MSFTPTPGIIISDPSLGIPFCKCSLFRYAFCRTHHFHSSVTATWPFPSFGPFLHVLSINFLLSLLRRLSPAGLMTHPPDARLPTLYDVSSRHSATDTRRRILPTLPPDAQLLTPDGVSSQRSAADTPRRVLPDVLTIATRPTPIQPSSTHPTSDACRQPSSASNSHQPTTPVHHNQPLVPHHPSFTGPVRVRHVNPFYYINLPVNRFSTPLTATHQCRNRSPRAGSPGQ